MMHMTTTAAPTATDVQFFSLLFQFTVEAYKTYQKLAENLPNPLSARLFTHFAQDERGVRDLLELKYLQIEERVSITLGADLRFQEILEGDLAPVEIPELLMSREGAMEKKLLAAADTSNETDATLYRYIAAIKRGHVAALERERRMVSLHDDWFRREDAASILTSGRAVR
jgi:rubrerythrin